MKTLIVDRVDTQYIICREKTEKKNKEEKLFAILQEDVKQKLKKGDIITIDDEGVISKVN